MQLNSRLTKLKSQIGTILWITFFWTLISLSQFTIGYLTLLDLSCNLEGISVQAYVWGSFITGIFAGLTGGMLIVFVWSKWLRTKSYGQSLLGIFWSYTLIYVLVRVATEFVGPGQSQPQSLGTSGILGLPMDSINNIYNYLFWLFVTLLTLIAMLVNDKYGPGVFLSFLMGKYFQPKREERIFMFLDLRASTSIAEKLGESQYFNFLKDVFRDATPAITKSKGEIYQYVGDEIVISWKKDLGFKQANCLQCFFDIQQGLLDKTSYYQESYENTVPEFKAGLHYGFVMVGEIGILKRDIAYSGDVLNTTARIQSKCNEIGVNILVSEYLVRSLSAISKIFDPKPIGEMALRGKQEAVMLYTV